LSKAHVIVYSRPGCHLCDDAKEAIHNAGCDDSFTLEVINIETSRDLLLKYQFDIPVVTINGEESFRHRVDTIEFKNRIVSIGGDSARSKV
jgi:glutaredoxin